MVDPVDLQGELAYGWWRQIDWSLLDGAVQEGIDRLDVSVRERLVAESTVPSPNGGVMLNLEAAPFDRHGMLLVGTPELGPLVKISFWQLVPGLARPKV